MAPGLRSAALAGNPGAEYELALRYAEGRGVPPNLEEAVHWFERAANHDLAPAQYRLGSLYEKGQGVKKDLEAARRYAREHWRPEGMVVKTDGLADVVSVVVADTLDEVLCELDHALLEDRYGPAGRRVILEERLVGPEASILAFVDGRDFKLLPAAQDHKALYEGNRGPNTEGIGAYAPAAH